LDDKTLVWSEVHNSPKIPWYWQYHDFKYIVFARAPKHLLAQIPWYSQISSIVLQTSLNGQKGVKLCT